MAPAPRPGGIGRATAAIFAPGTVLLGRMRYATKFAFIGLVLLLPLAFVALAYIRTQDEQIAFSAKERVGVAYMEPLVALTAEEVDRTRRTGPGKASPSLMAAVARVDAADRRRGAELGVREGWATARRLVLAAAGDRDPETVAQAHRSATTALLGLIVAVGDASNLTLDPDLDSYYLMDALQFRLPAMLDTSSRLVDSSQQESAEPLGGARTTAYGIGALVGALEREMAALSRGLATTVRTTGSAALERRLPDAERRLGQATAALTARYVESVESRVRTDMRPDAAAAVQRQVSSLTDLVAPQLDELLTRRIDRLEANTRRVQFITLLAALLAAYLFIGFYRSVGSPVRAMVAALRAVGDGDFTKTVVVETRDELHQIAEAINHTVARTKEATDRLERQANHDPLTGLPNRALILDGLMQSLARVARRERSIALLFIDLDRFKLVNDLRGHETGDAVLCTVAERLCAIVRPSDTVGRLAGDEFVIVCEEVGDASSALALAGRVTDSLSAPIPTPGHADVSIGASVGIAFAEPGRVSQPDRLIRDADAAMYRAKDRGGGRVEVFDEVLAAAGASRVAGAGVAAAE